MHVEAQQRSPSTKPELWNPNAAVNWSLLFTPIFGAYLHALNWRTLGQTKPAAMSMYWVWGTAVFLLTNVVFLFLPDSVDPGDKTWRRAQIGLVATWYCVLGRTLAKHVKGSFPDGYIKKRWKTPLTIGFVGAGAWHGLLQVLAKLFQSP